MRRAHDIAKGRHVARLVAGLMLVAVVRASAGEVTVVGAAAPDNPSEFEWTVTNGTSQPLTRVRFHHYHGVLAPLPPGWHESAMTGNTARGDQLMPGIIEFSADQPRNGIRPGDTLRFRVRMSAEWDHALARKTIEAELADGAVVQIADVLCPAKTSALRHNMPLLGLATIFVIYVTIQAVRRRKAPPERPG